MLMLDDDQRSAVLTAAARLNDRAFGTVLRTLARHGYREAYDAALSLIEVGPSDREFGLRG
jgi:hypothetical protein